MICKGFVFVYLACFFLHAFGQDASIVSVTCNLGSGRGCVVEKVLQADGSYLGKVLTAAHVVEPMQIIHNGQSAFVLPEFTVKFSNGDSVKALSIIERRELGEGDTAIIVCKIPAAIDAVELGDATEGDSVVWHLQDGNFTEKIKAVDVKGKSVYSDLKLRPGDSGGPVSFNGKIIGVISGGKFWMEKEVIDSSTGEKKIKLFTWPARAGIAK